MIEYLPLLALCACGVLWYVAWHHCKKGKFYQEVWWTWPLGIFVWGDALVLALWWAGVAIASWWLTPIWLLRVILLFWSVRAFYEVIYWLNHQAVKSAEIPPLLRKITWIGPNEAAILYQVGQMSVGITALIALALTTQL